MASLHRGSPTEVLAVDRHAKEGHRQLIGRPLAPTHRTLPHVIGAPHPETPGDLAPEELEHKFFIVAVATSLVFWLVLGVLTGAFFTRYATQETAAA